MDIDQGELVRSENDKIKDEDEYDKPWTKCMYNDEDEVEAVAAATQSGTAIASTLSRNVLSESNARMEMKMLLTREPFHHQGIKRLGRASTLTDVLYWMNRYLKSIIARLEVPLKIPHDDTATYQAPN